MLSSSRTIRGPTVSPSLRSGIGLGRRSAVTVIAVQGCRAACLALEVLLGDQSPHHPDVHCNSGVRVVVRRLTLSRLARLPATVGPGVDHWTISGASSRTVSPPVVPHSTMA